MGRWEGREIGGGGEWGVEGGLNALLGLFRLAMGPRNASQRPKYGYMTEGRSPYHWGEVHISCLPCSALMGPMVSFINLQGQQNLLTLKKQTG